MDETVSLHKDLAESGRWFDLPFEVQMAHIGSEVFRAGKWKTKGKADRAQNAADRALELMDFTVAGMIENHKNPRELLRMRELICDYFYGSNEYDSTPESLNRYFDPFAIKASRLHNQ